VSLEQGKFDGPAGAAVNDGQAPAALSGAVAQALAQNEESIARALQALVRMEQEGTLQELADLLAVVKLVRQALSDDMVVSLARRIEGLAAIVTDPALTAMAARLPGALRAAEAAADRAAAEPPGLLALLKEMRDPGVRRGLVCFLTLAKHLAPEPSPAGKVDAST